MALDFPHPVLSLGLGLVHDMGDQTLARLRGGQPGDPLELDNVALLDLRQANALGFQLGGTGCEAGLALLERADLPVERFLPVEDPALGALDGGALLAPLFFGGTAQLEGFVLSLEDDLLLLRARLDNETLGVLLG